MERGDHPNEMLFEGNIKLSYRVQNYFDFEHLICRTPEDILSEIEEEVECPLAFLSFRLEFSAVHHTTVKEVYQASEKLIWKCVNCNDIPLFADPTTRKEYTWQKPKARSRKNKSASTASKTSASR